MRRAAQLMAGALLLGGCHLALSLDDYVLTDPPSYASVTRLSAGSVTLAGAETSEQHDARMAWWREARFGMAVIAKRKQRLHRLRRDRVRSGQCLDVLDVAVGGIFRAGAGPH